MKVLVTGCAGFIGSKVCETLISREDTVVGVDNLNHAYDVRLKEWRLAQLETLPGFTFHRLDISDRDQLQYWFQRNGSTPSIDAVINLAARAGVRQSLVDPWVYYETNVTGTLNLLELCKDNGIGKFVLSSTSSVYGESERPFREDAPTDRPTSPYAASKKAAEVLCYTYTLLHGLDVTILRYFTVYGPGGRPDMSPFRFIKWIAEGEPLTLFGDGLQERDFTYVDDIACGTVAALAPVSYEVVNLGNDQPATILSLISIIEELLGKSAQIQQLEAHPSDVRGTWADITKARVRLGWSPQISLQEGLKRSVEWYQQNRHWAKDIKI